MTVFGAIRLNRRCFGKLWRPKDVENNSGPRLTVVEKLTKLHQILEIGIFIVISFVINTL